MMPTFKKIQTQDGTWTYFHPVYDQCYHSIVGAKTEAREKFLFPSRILSFSCVKLLDIGFGLGYNALEAWQAHDHIHIVSLEKDKEILKLLGQIHKEPSLKPLLQALETEKSFETKGKSLSILIGDARETTQSLLEDQKSFHAIFLDAFSPPSNPELWTIQFFRHLYALLENGGCLLTYSSALPVLWALRKVGFQLYYTPSVGRTRGGIIAFKPPFQEEYSQLFKPLTTKDEFFLSCSVRALPNIDKGGKTSQEIKKYRDRLSELTLRLGVSLPHKRAEKIWKIEQEPHNEFYHTT